MPVDLGVALMPSREIRQFIIELNRELGRLYPVSYELGEQYHPHLSLYQSTFENSEMLKDAVCELGEIESTEIILRNLIGFPSRYVTLQCAPEGRLQSLHESVLRRASQVRAIGVPSIWERNTVSLTPEKIENVRRYGYPDTFEFYDPHYTIGRITSESPDMNAVLEELGKTAKPYLGQATTSLEIVIYELSPDGACTNPRKIK